MHEEVCSRGGCRAGVPLSPRAKLAGRDSWVLAGTTAPSEPAPRDLHTLECRALRFVQLSDRAWTTRGSLDYEHPPSSKLTLSIPITPQRMRFLFVRQGGSHPRGGGKRETRLLIIIFALATACYCLLPLATAVTRGNKDRGYG
jgi:hypothetical protein